MNLEAPMPMEATGRIPSGTSPENREVELSERKRTKSLRSFSRPSLNLARRTIGFQCSQSSSEQAAIGIDRKALAPPPRIAGRASGVLTVGDFPLRSGP